MKPNSVQKKRLILQGTYWKHFEEWSCSEDALNRVVSKLEAVGRSVSSTDECWDLYRSGPTTIEINPSYQMDEAGFSTYLRELKVAIEAIGKLEHGKPIEQKVSERVGLFFEKYAVVTKSIAHSGSPDEQRYFNLKFYPRTGNRRRALFRGFLDVYLKLWHSVDMSRSPRGMRSLSSEDMRLIDKMRKYAGTERGSQRFIGEELMERDGLKTGRKIARYQQRVKRYSRRKHDQSLQK